MGMKRKGDALLGEHFLRGVLWARTLGLPNSKGRLVPLKPHL